MTKTSPEDTAFANRLNLLIRQKRFARAREIGQAYVADKFPSKVSMHIWLALALTSALVKLPADHNPAWYWRLAEQATDYDTLVTGDILREHVVILVRTGKQSEGSPFIERIEQLHRGNNEHDRQAKLVATEARLAFAQGDVDDARRLHRRANSMWESVSIRQLLNKEGGIKSPSWVRDNWFGWLRACVMTDCDYLLPSLSIEVYEPRRDRRIRARLMLRFGKRAVRLDQWLDRLAL